MKRILLILMITQWNVLLNSFAVNSEKKLLDLNSINLLSIKIIKTAFCCLPSLTPKLDWFHERLLRTIISIQVWKCIG